MHRLYYKRCLCLASDNTDAETAENMATTLKACNVPILATEVLCIASTQANAERIVNVATTLNLDKDRTIIAHRNESVCIQGSMIGRTDKNGPQGSETNKGVCFTLNTIDRHAVAYEADECLCLSGNFCDRETTMNGSGMRTGASFTLNTVDRHAVAYDARNNKLGEGVSGTLQAKENGGYSRNFINPIIEAAPRYIVRRLMPIECGRLQGFPDGWAEIETLPPDMEPETAAFWRQVYATDCAIKGKRTRKSILERVDKLAAWHNSLHTDSAEYKMWGNGMALPNALFFVSRALAQISAEENRPVESLKLGSLFDGSGTMPLCATMCGAKAAWASEIEPYPIAVTKTHLPGMKHLGSVTDIDGGKIEPVDIITFGSPCQDLSIAGKRAGLDGNRSGLFREAIRIILEMLEATGWKYPRFVIWENVPGALSSNGGKDFETVLNELLRLTGTDQFVRQRGKWGALQGTELWPTDLSMRNTGEYPNGGAEYMLSQILVENPPTKYYLSVKAMDGILNRASRRGKKLPELLVTAIAGMKEWWRQNPRGGGYDPAYTLKIRSGCEGGGKGALVQTDLSATLATNNDQTLFAVDQGGGKSAANILDNVSPTMTCTHGGEPAVAYGFIYKQGAKAGSVGAGEVAPTIKTDQPPAAAYANGTETVARTLTARADGSPMLDRGQNAVIQKGNEHERMVEEK